MVDLCEWKWVQTNAGGLHGGYYLTGCGRRDDVNNPHSPCIYCRRRIGSPNDAAEKP